MARSSIRLGVNVPAIPPVSNVKLAVRFGRLVGLDSAMFWDHFQNFLPQALWSEEHVWLARDQPWAHEHYDYQVLLGYLASIAGNMRLGVGVTEPQRRHPVLIAQALMTLSHLTRRPPILGIGPGEQENTVPYGVPMEKPVARLEEALQIIRMCFTSRGPFDFNGEHFQLNNAVMDLVPAKGKAPPIWLAAHGPRMMRLTGQYGDGWYPAIRMTPDGYGDRLSTIRRHASESGRDPDAIMPSLQVTTLLTPTDEDARDIMNLRIARYLGLSMPDEVFKRYGMTHPFGDGFQGYADVLPEEIPIDKLEAAMDVIEPEFLQEALVWGSPDKVAAEFHRLAEAGLRHVVLLPASVLASKKMLRYLPRGLFSLRRKLQ